MLALPILTIPPYFFPPDFGKTIVFRSVMTVLLLLYSFQIIFKRQSFSFANFKKNPIAFALIALFIIFLLASIFSVDPSFSFWGNPLRGGGFVNLAFYIIFALITSMLFQKHDWSKAWNVSIITGVLVSLVAVIQYLGLFKSIFVPAPNRPPSTLGNPIILAIYLLLLLFLTLVFFIKEKRLPYKIGYGCIVALFLFVMLISGSRSAYLGCIIGAIYFLLFYPKKFPALKIIIALSLIIVAGVIFYTNTQTHFPTFLENNRLFQTLQPRLSVTSFLEDARFPAWRVGFQGFLEKPLLGWGPENYSVAFDKYYNASVGINEVQWWDRAHNVALEMMVTTGLFALLAYIALLGMVFWKLHTLKHHKNADPTSVNPLIAHGIQATLIAYIVANIFSFDAFPSYVLFFLLIGYSLHLVYNIPISLPKNTNYQPSATKKIIFGFLILLAGWFLWQYNLMPFLINANVNKASALADQKNCSQTFATMDTLLPQRSFLDSYVKLEYAEFIKKCATFYPENRLTYIKKSKNLIGEAVKIQPLYTRYWIFLANTTNAIAEQEPNPETKKALIQEIQNDLDQALKLAPNHQEIFMELADMEINKQDYQKAIEYAKKCVSLNSDLSDCFWHLALSQIYAKDVTSAQENIQTAYDKGYDTISQISLEQLSNAYGSISDYQNLVSVYEKLVVMNPHTAQYHSSLAFFYKQVGQYKKAREQALITLELSPESKPNVDEFLKTLP